MPKLKAVDRRRIADRAAELAVDQFEEFCKRFTFDCENCGERASWGRVFPEELLELQHNLEDELYRELA